VVPAERLIKLPDAIAFDVAASVMLKGLTAQFLLTSCYPVKAGEITAGKGCDVVYDSVGKDTWRGSLKCLRMRGMFVHFGQSSGMIADFKFSELASGGSLYATRPMLFDYIKTREELSSRAGDLFARLASGQVKAQIGQRVALQDAAAAHRDLESRRTMGATVLLTS
jgi:NADPH2:quinone reductase